MQFYYIFHMNITLLSHFLKDAFRTDPCLLRLAGHITKLGWNRVDENKRCSLNKHNFN